MTSEVRIILTAVDKASGVLKGTTTNVKGMLTAIGAVSGVAIAAGKAVQKIADETVAYNKSIREMTQVTGLGAEEISRIVQVADDWGVSIDQVRTALAFMNKQGVTPSIDKLAELADSYVASADKSKWAADAVKILGRGYQTLIPLFAKGGDALRKQADAVDESLIATDESIRVAREYEVALDDWNDSVQGLTMSIGSKLLPALSKLINLANSPSADSAAEFINTVFAGTPIESAAGRQARATSAYGTALEKAAEAQTRFYSGVMMVNEMMDEGEPIVYDYVYRVTDVDKEASRAAQAVTNFAIGVDKTCEAAENAKTPLDDFLDGVDRQIDSPIAAFIKDLEWFQAGGGQIEAAFAAVQEALASGAITPDQADAFAKELYVATTDLQLELNQIDAKQAAANLEDTLGASAAKVAMEKIKGTDGIQGALEQITGIKYYLDFYIRVHGTLPTGNSTTTTVDDDDDEHGRAAGGPVMAGGRYLVGERGPEILQMGGTGGTIIPNHQIGGMGGNIDITINAAPGMDVNAVANAVIQKLSIASRTRGAGGYARGA